MSTAIPKHADHKPKTQLFGFGRAFEHPSRWANIPETTKASLANFMEYERLYAKLGRIYDHALPVAVHSALEKWIAHSDADPTSWETIKDNLLRSPTRIITKTQLEKLEAKKLHNNVTKLAREMILLRRTV
jgi:hypothetical protein